MWSIIWLLERGLLTQIHKYVYITMPIHTKHKEEEDAARSDMLRNSSVHPGAQSDCYREEEWGTERCISCSRHSSTAVCDVCASEKSTTGSTTDDDRSSLVDIDGEVKVGALTEPDYLTLDSFTEEEWIARKRVWSDENLLNAETEKQFKNVLMEALCLDYKFPSVPDAEALSLNMAHKHLSLGFDYVNFRELCRMEGERERSFKRQLQTNRNSREKSKTWIDFNKEDILAPNTARNYSLLKGVLRSKSVELVEDYYTKKKKKSVSWMNLQPGLFFGSPFITRS